MPSIDVTIEVDSTRCKAHIDEWGKLNKLHGHEASHEAAEDLKRLYHILMDRFHPWDTKTPASPGTPAASVSGEMRESVLVMPDGEGFMVGPTARWSRIQELGGVMHGHPFMHFFWEGRWWKKSVIRLPARPVLKPALREARTTGELGRIFRRRWERAQREAM